MKRKPSLGPRNPHVAPSLFRKAGAHRKSNKVQRARDKQDTRRLAQPGSAAGFYPEGCGFDSHGADQVSRAAC